MKVDVINLLMVLLCKSIYSVEYINEAYIDNRAKEKNIYPCKK